VIRVGTPRELKNCCGGETQVRMILADRNSLSAAVTALQELGESNIHTDVDLGKISFPALEGIAVLNKAVALLDKAGIKIVEIGLQQPTLDDVFLTLTGHATEDEVKRK
jgi:ABC-2 type transport system ATP-binding protein